MTTPTQPRVAAAPARGAGPDAALTRAGRASQALTGRGSGDTPRRLRLARLVHVLLAVALGAGAVLTGAELNDRVATAALHTAQLERATSIETSLQYAQENAGETPASGAVLPEKTQNALDTATTALIEMADAGTDQTTSLAAVASLISRYAATLAAGRAAPAKELLENELLPAVRQLQTDHSAVSGTVVSWWMWLVPVGAWLAFAAIAGIAWYTARVSHRVLNLGLVAAALATAALALRSGTTLVQATAADPDFIVVAVACALVSAVAGTWGLHQRLKEYR